MTVHDPSRVPAVPWRNGAGTTRELAASTDADGATLWRISVADLVDDATFSAFPGMDRLFVALGDLRLDVDGSVVDLRPGAQARFRGEARASVRLDEPTRALNVMTRRGSCWADVVQRDGAAPPAVDPHLTVDLGDSVADILLTPHPEVARG